MTHRDVRSRRRPKQLIAVALLCATGPTIAACGSPSSQGSAGSSTLTIAETTGPSTLDPEASSLMADRFAWSLSYECLLNTKADGAIEPALATSYKQSADHLSYTFTLRPNVKFQNGAAMTSADVVYTFDRLMKGTQGISKELFPTLKGVTADSPTSVTFTLSSADAGFVNNMANPLVWGCAILSKKAGESNKLGLNMVGTGPWQQMSYRSKSELKLTRYANYWGTKAATKNLDVLYVPNSTTQVSDLQAGKVDLILADGAGAKSLAGNSKVSVDKIVSDSTAFLQINNLSKPFDNQLVRQALTLAINRDQLAEKAYQGAATASAYVPPGTSWAPTANKLANSQQDIAKAKTLLAQAGYPNGFSTSLMYLSNYDSGTNDLNAAIKSQLAAVGIKVELQPLQVAAWGDKLIHAKYALSWNAQSYYSNPYQYVQPADGRQGPVPASLQSLLNKALQAGSVAEYQAAIVAIENEEATLVYPTITLLALDAYVGYSKSLSGVSVPSSLSRQFLAAVTHD
jgi:ABC-type transport system substrate-binding protein